MSRLWDPCSKLAREGTWLLEASAGTGKTWQLASLVARLVVEQTPPVPIEKILIITFTNAATAELRDRVRKRLVEIRDTLTELLIDASTLPELRQPILDDDDPRDHVLRHLCVGPRDQPELTQEQQRQRLLLAKVALSNFDLAPISTIHGFCQRMLDTLAFESGQDSGLQLLEDVTPLRDELVADAIAREQATASTEHWTAYQKEWSWTQGTLASVAEKACSASGTRIEPAMDNEAVREALQRVDAATDTLRKLLEGAAWSALADALVADAAARPKAYAAKMKTADLQARLGTIRAWLGGRGTTTGACEALKRFDVTGMKAQLKNVPTTPLKTKHGPNVDAILANYATAMSAGPSPTECASWHQRLWDLFETGAGGALAEEMASDAARRPDQYAKNWQAEHWRGWRACILAWKPTNSPPATVAKAMGRFETSQRAKALKKSCPREPLPGATAIQHQVSSTLKALLDAKAAINPLAAFANTARDAVEDNLRARRAITFDSMLTNLAAAIERERDAGEDRPLRDAIYEQFEVALIDEFQDTDMAQWTVMREVFHQASERRLFLIGDPKQAIYRFRGADVYVYLDAKKLVTQGATNAAHRRSDETGGAVDVGGNASARDLLAGGSGQFTMAKNYRSDGPLVRALNTLWGRETQAFGDLQMDYEPVTWPPRQAQACLLGTPMVVRRDQGQTPRQPLEIRWLDGGPAPDGSRVLISGKDDGLRAAADCCAREIGLLLDSDAVVVPRPNADEVEDIDARQRVADGRSLQPGDFAVLVHQHKHGRLVKLALAKRGIMAVTAGKNTVFESAVASWILQLLDALAQPKSEATSRALAVNPLIGFTLQQLAEALDAAAEGPSLGSHPEDESTTTASRRVASSTRASRADKQLRWDQWRSQIEAWAERWSKHRFAGVMQRISREYDILAHLLGLEDGERLATDYRHLFELCHVAEQEHHFGPAGLADWLRKERARASSSGRGASTPRLESDARAVQIVTTYSAKGLQYPVVMLPFAWATSSGPQTYAPLVVHGQLGNEPTAAVRSDAQAVLTVYRKDTGAYKAAKAQDGVEELEERLRKLYVELTRAEHHCVVWGGAIGRDFHKSAFNALILRPDGHRGLPYDEVKKAWAGLRKQPTKASKDPDAVHAVRHASIERAAALLDARFDGATGIGWRFDCVAAGRSKRYQGDQEARTELATRTYAGRERLASAWRRASFTSMAPSLGSADEHAVPLLQPQEQADAALRGGMDEPSDAPGRDDSVQQDDDIRPPRLGLRGDATQLAPLPLAAMWGGTKVGTWAHAVLEVLNFQPQDDTGETESNPDVAIEPDEALTRAAAQSPYVRRRQPREKEPQSAFALAAELGVLHGHRRKEDHALFVAALPQILGAPLSVPGIAPPFRLPEGYCLASLLLADRIDELSFDMSLMGGDAWRPERNGQRSNRIDSEALKRAFALRASGGLHADGWDGTTWIDGLLARVQASEDAHATWTTLDPKDRPKEPKIRSILPKIAGMLTGFIDLTFRATCEDGNTRYFIADYKTNKITSPGQREISRQHYTRPWLAWSMAHSNYHLQSLIYTVALHRFLGRRLAGYDVNSEASYNAHIGGHFYLYLRGMAAPFVTDPVHVHGVYADRWPWQVIDAFDRALDPGLRPPLPLKPASEEVSS